MFFSAAFNLSSQFTGKERDAEKGLDYFGAAGNPTAKWHWIPQTA